MRLTNPWNASIEDLMAQSLDNWRGFADWLATSDATCIFDARLFHCHTDMYFWRNTPVAAIRDLVHSITDIIKPLDPMLIYLYKPDVRVAWMMNEKKENERYFARQLRILDRPYALDHNTKGRNLEGLIAVFEDYRPVIDALYEELPLRKLSIDTLDGDWADYYARVWSFLGVPASPLNRDANRSMVKRVNITPRKRLVHNPRPSAIHLKLLPYKSRDIESVTDIAPDELYELNGMLAERYRFYDYEDSPIQDIILDGDRTTLSIF